MHLANILARWASPENLVLEKRAPVPATASNIISNVINTLTNTDISTPTVTVVTQTSAPPKTTPTTEAPQTTDTPAPQTTQTPTQQNTSNTTPTNTPDTTSSQPSSAKQSSSAAKTTAPSNTTANTVITATNAPTGTTDTPESIPTSADPTSTNVSVSKGSSGGSNVGLAVGVVVGVVGGFAVIVLAIIIWRRHRRRQHLERLGSMEELARAPSPPLLSRSLTRGQGPRKPIEEDDDDFLTPMDTLPNAHKMDEWHTGEEPVQTASYFEEGKEGYHAEDNYHYDYDAQAMPNLPPSFPVPPPAAVVPANPRFYSGDMGSRPGTPGSGGSGGNNTGAIPSYSAMNKYTAYSPAGGSTSPPPQNGGTSPINPPFVQSETRQQRGGSVGSFSRPGAYRNYE